LGSTREGPLYRAEYPTGLEVALLILGAESGGHEPSVGSGPLPHLHPRFRQAAKIRHLNVAAVHEIGEIPDGPNYLVLECLAGESLSEILAERGVLPPDEAVDLFLQAAAGLEAAHEAGLVHANLSPDNILVTQTADGPLVKLIGFALVSSLPPALKKPIDREVGVEYASPERLAGYIPDERSDVYSLAAVLHHLLVGAPPGFGSEGFVSVAMRATVVKAVLPIPEHRFQTMSEFVGAVKRAAAVATGPNRVRKRRPVLLTAGGIIALAAGGLLLLASLHGRGWGADGLAQEPDTRTPASGVPAEGTETGSTLLASGGEGRREAPFASRATLPAPAASEDSTESPAAPDASKVRQEKPASLRKTSVAATPKVVEERRRPRGEAAERALNGPGQIQTPPPSPASGHDPA
ncbi:MAG: protein kinase domain-containing protein, partial [Actinomycetota bacterium]